MWKVSIGVETADFPPRSYVETSPFPKKLVWTLKLSEPNHSQSISSRSSDSRMKELTIPVPGDALTLAVTFPKKIYFSDSMVGASFLAVMENSAPFVPYVIDVPSASCQKSSLPLVKSVLCVVPKAGSAGHAERFVSILSPVLIEEIAYSSW